MAAVDPSDGGRAGKSYAIGQIEWIVCGAELRTCAIRFSFVSGSVAACLLPMLLLLLLLLLLTLTLLLPLPSELLMKSTTPPACCWATMLAALLGAGAGQLPSTVLGGAGIRASLLREDDLLLMLPLGGGAGRLPILCTLALLFVFVALGGGTGILASLL